MSAALASKYAHMVIDKDGKRVRLDGRTTTFNYYESLYSPFATANMIFVDTGDSVVASKETGVEGRLGTIKDNLPITGYENLEFKIETKYGTIDFKNKPFIVDGASTPSQDATLQGVFLPLISGEGMINQQKPLHKKYTGKISDTVVKILSEEMNISKNRIFVEPTSNVYNFTTPPKGGPLDHILKLCKKSIPVGGDPGYFFYQTQDGFNFRSIDFLLNQEPKATYNYNEKLDSNLDNDVNDFKILNSPSFIKDQDVLSALRSGTYFSRNVFFDPRTFQYDEVIFNLSEKGVKRTLGKIPPYLNKIKSYTRTHFHILDIGSLDPNISININNDPREWQAKSTMRYNLLHSQIVQIQVPCNSNLRAGDIIKCNISAITQGQKELGVYDAHRSGRYLILNLCHHFDTTRSYTSLTLLRDTYGLYTNKK